MKSKITSKYQVTIPKEIRNKLKLKVSDSIEWKIEDEKVVVEPLDKPFLKHKGSIKIEPGNIKDDILKAREERAYKHS